MELQTGVTTLCVLVLLGIVVVSGLLEMFYYESKKFIKEVKLEYQIKSWKIFKYVFSNSDNAKSMIVLFLATTTTVKIIPSPTVSIW